METLLPSPDSAFQLGDFLPMVKVRQKVFVILEMSSMNHHQAVGSHFVTTRRSPLESVLKTNGEEEEQGGRSLFLRGWLTEAETAEVTILFPMCW